MNNYQDQRDSITPQELRKLFIYELFDAAILRAKLARRKKKYWDRYRVAYVAFVPFVIIIGQLIAYLMSDDKDIARGITVVVVSLAWWVGGIFAGRTILKKDD